MIDNRINIKHSMIRWAIERSGKEQGFFTKSFPKLSLWGKNVKPTLKQLQDFSKKATIPFGYLFLEEPLVETLPVPDYRTVDDKYIMSSPSPELIETICLMQRRQDWLRSYRIENGSQSLDFAASFSKSNDVEIAKNIRKTLGLDCSWSENCRNWSVALDELNRKIEDVGIMLIFDGIVKNNTKRKLLVEEFRGFVLYDEYAPLIFVNNSDAKSAQMFTIAHELAHLWLNAGGIFNLDRMQPGKGEIEIRCSNIAAEFLAPESEFHKLWKEKRYKFDSIAQSFKVSTIVCARRALDLGLISKEKFFSYYENSTKRLKDIKKSDKKVDFYKMQRYRIGRNLSVAIKNALADGSLLYRDAYNLTGLRGKTFDKYVKEFEPL
ncbi:MAG: ImmA/IrrE family metallo-endopeptidase [Endomicrobium sp.]|jgi:Zn-dependent peptidase ImmA (M78 family)|nr:ImmA/IrrE family metallo-endopeptidase [Endomicrobium sp.]